mmetsp:Transcript_90843/g.252733  ORF Transcript_90843/g.252733 Transcript_90843/m.252733 type:complete len:229 (-) Transcript_90843:33-719(-)
MADGSSPKRWWDGSLPKSACTRHAMIGTSLGITAPPHLCLAPCTWRECTPPAARPPRRRGSAAPPRPQSPACRPRPPGPARCRPPCRAAAAPAPCRRHQWRGRLPGRRRRPCRQRRPTRVPPPELPPLASAARTRPAAPGRRRCCGTTGCSRCRRRSPACGAPHPPRRCTPLGTGDPRGTTCLREHRGRHFQDRTGGPQGAWCRLARWSWSRRLAPAGRRRWTGPRSR